LDALAVNPVLEFSMKKNLIAMAVLAASTGAMAQSSVTIYGRVDLSVGAEKNLGESSQSKMFNGGEAGLTTSRWGLIGTEDLGGGLKAKFKFEQRINATTGEIQSPSFKAETSVGLAGGFGAVKMGRFTTVYDDVIALGNSNIVFDSAFTPASNGVYKSGGDYSSRFNNQMRYETPSMGGFYAALNYAFEQTTDEKDTMSGFKLGYKNGPVDVGLGYQNEKASENKFTALSAAYDLGMAALSAGYSNRQGSDANGDDAEFTLGVTVPVGAVKLSGGFASSKTTVGGGTASKASGFALGATYSLSKRTRLYAGLRDYTVEDGAGVKSKDNTVYAVGVRHDF
jgi:predicted porin